MKLHNYISKVMVAAALPLMGVCGGLLTSCSDMFDSDSEMVQYADDHKLNSPQDSLYSVMGIIRQMQVVADRQILLGELRADYMVATPKANKDLKDLANLDFSGDNKYNQISDYYAIINSCNYFIANADMNLKKLGKVVFEKEFAAVKTYRAWTYLQLAKIYGEVPLVLEPVMTEAEAEKAMQNPTVDIYGVCSYFIDDIKPYVDTELPQYGSINGISSQKFFIPVRVLLGEMCLWTGRYQESAKYFGDYLTFKTDPKPTLTSSVRWSVGADFDFSTGSVFSSGYTGNLVDPNSPEIITVIPMESSEFYGVRSELVDIFTSTENNYYYYQAAPSDALREASAAETYCYYNSANGKKDTIWVTKKNLPKSNMAGDLRLYMNTSDRVVNRDEYSKYSSDVRSIDKFEYSKFLPIYRLQYVYLMYAEALNRAGYPQHAFCILKYGLRENNILNYITQGERELAKGVIVFDKEVFTENNTLGVHARGCGDAMYDDSTYVMPLPPMELATYADTAAYMRPFVEEMIFREMGLEMMFEGTRYYDLMRFAMHTNDPQKFIKPLLKRPDAESKNLAAFLSDKKNWFLPKK